MKNNNKLFKTILYTISIVLIAIGVFWGSYYAFIKNSNFVYKITLKECANNITKINENLEISSLEIKNADKNKKQIISTLNNSANSLTKIKNRLTQLNYTSKYTNINQSLITGITNNILIYKQVTSILNNPNAMDLNASLTSLKTYDDNCVDAYSSIDGNIISITLPSKILALINNVTNYASTFGATHEDMDIHKSQNDEFLNNLNSINTNFLKIKTDFSSELRTIRDGSGNYDKIIQSINSNKDCFDDLEKNFSHIIVPSEGADIYKLFSKVLGSYDDYIQDMIYAVNMEKNDEESSSDDSSFVDNLYSTSSDDLESANYYYDEFIVKFSKYKNSND